MLERLDYFKIAPRRILDAGSGPGREAKALAARYRAAQLVALDFSLPILRRARGWFSFLSRRHAVCADLSRLPLAAESIDLVWSNMALHWSDDPAAVLGEFRRVLAADGLVMFSTLGPDTLKELRAAAGVGRVHAFADMHDIGDMLVGAGFSAPVMDMEMLSLSYPRAADLLADLRASGQTCARDDRPRGLAGRRFRERLLAALPAQASFEVVYGHAWKGAPRERPETVKTIGLYRRLS